MSMVHFKTTIRSALPAQHPRNRALREFLLARQGYVQQAEAPRWQIATHHVQGQDLKALLRGNGFDDTEFQIRVEYQRRWGFL